MKAMRMKVKWLQRERIISLLAVIALVMGLVLMPMSTTAAEGDVRPAPATPAFDEGVMSASARVQTPAAVKSRSASVSTFSLTEGLQAGGDRLAALQNTDGGWDWPLDDGNPGNTSPRNTIGPIAMGLAQAYYQTEDADHLASLANAGALLLTKTNNFSPSDGYLAAQLDQVFGGTTYRDYVTANFYARLAAGTYNRSGLGTLYNTTGYVNLIRTNRSGSQANIAAWDLGMGLVGAASAGASTTEWIAGVKAEIDELNKGNGIATGWYDVIGLAGAVYGLAFVNAEYDPQAGEHAAASSLADLAAILASYQIDNGGFTWNANFVIPNDANEAIQETSYAILALNEVNRSLYWDSISGAAQYIRDVQLATGGWDGGGGENNEITAEALWALVVTFAPWLGTQTEEVVSDTLLPNESVSLPGGGVVVENTGTDSPIVMLAEYTGDPGSVGTFDSGGSYYDINVSGTTNGDGNILEITLQGSGSLNYFDGTTWVAVVGTGGLVTDGGTGVFTFILNNTTTTPRLYELTGTVFSGFLEQIRITPSRTVIAAGETFQVTVDAASAALFGVDVSMSFDSTELEVTSIALGKGTAAAGLDAETVAKNTYDASTLRFAYSQRAPKDNVGGVNLVMATITFRAKVAGATSITMDAALFTDKDGTPATPGFLDSPIALTIDPSPSVVASVELQGRSDYSGATLELVPTTAGNVLIDPSSTGAGALDFDPVPAATYDVRISAVKYLAATKQATIVSGNSVVNLTTSPLRLLGGDINGDDRINIQDLVLIGASFGSTVNLGADINNDGVVNIQDLAIAAGNYGKVTADYGSW